MLEYPESHARRHGLHARILFSERPGPLYAQVVRLGQHPLWGVDSPGSGRASGSAFENLAVGQAIVFQWPAEFDSGVAPRRAKELSRATIRSRSSPSGIAASVNRWLRPSSSPGRSPGRNRASCPHGAPPDQAAFVRSSCRCNRSRSASCCWCRA